MTSPYSAYSSWGPGRNFTARATGTPSAWGRGSAARSILNPWGGPNVPKSTVSTAKFGPGSRRSPTPDASLFSMNYTANDPLQWPIVLNASTGLRRGPTSGMTQAKADFWNAAVNHAYARLYAGV
jgi:hypothetical protein